MSGAPANVSTETGEPAFSSAEAFERNLGLVTKEEQRRLEGSLVSIAGCGGGGGFHAHTLARMGVGRFRLADPDTFSVANFNRQIGATVDTVGENKAETTARMIRAIHPRADVEIFQGGLDRRNADRFVEGADLVADGIDFFAITARRLLFSAARRAGVPAVTAAPLGFSGTLHVFTPAGVSFDDYFGMRDGQEPLDQLVRFAVGLAPAGLHLPYLDLASVDPATGRGPSSVIGCQLASCLVGAEAVRILLGRGGVHAAPEYLQFDAYRRRLRTGRLRRGSRGVLQGLKRRLLMRRAVELGWGEALERLLAERSRAPAVS
jgi:molybdopterin/thiamine biosynthesis adenylyltransferase